MCATCRGNRSAQAEHCRRDLDVSATTTSHAEESCGLCCCRFRGRDSRGLPPACPCRFQCRTDLGGCPSGIIQIADCISGFRLGYSDRLRVEVDAVGGLWMRRSAIPFTVWSGEFRAEVFYHMEISAKLSGQAPARLPQRFAVVRRESRGIAWSAQAEKLLLLARRPGCNGNC